MCIWIVLQWKLLSALLSRGKRKKRRGRLRKGYKHDTDYCYIILTPRLPSSSPPFYPLYLHQIRVLHAAMVCIIQDAIMILGQPRSIVTRLPTNVHKYAPAHSLTHSLPPSLPLTHVSLFLSPSHTPLRNINVVIGLLTRIGSFMY